MSDRLNKVIKFQEANRVNIGLPGLSDTAEFCMEGCVVCKSGGANVYNVDMISTDGKFTIVDKMPVCHECLCKSLNGDE